MVEANYKKQLIVVGLGVLIGLTGCSLFSDVKEKVVGAPVRDLSTVSFEKDVYPAVILGGGVGGMTASVYLAMANIKTLLIEGDMPGGLLTQSLSVRNWPGEIEAPGAIITDKIRAQAVKRGVEVVQEKVTHTNFDNWPFVITLTDINDPTKTRTVKALTAVIGTGASSNYLGVPGEKEYWSKGVTNCAVCEGSLYRDKTVCIIGGGDSAMEEASYLAGIAKRVYIFVRRDKLRAVDNRKDEVLAMDNVEVVYNTSLRSIKGDGKEVTSVMTKNNKGEADKEYPMDGVFLAIGFTPNSSIFEGQLELTSGKYIALKKDQETSVQGVYAVGDIVDPHYKQAVTAAGDGCRAALQAHEYLGTLGFRPQAAGMQRKEVVVRAESAMIEKKDAVAPADKPVMAAKDSGQVTDQAMNAEQQGVAYEAGAVHDVGTMEEYQALVASTDKPVVVDFYATWCGPCKQIAPLYKKLAIEYGDKVIFAKVNIDTLPDAGSQNQVRGVPTFVFLKGSEEQSRLVGASHTKKQFAAKVDELLAGK